MCPHGLKEKSFTLQYFPINTLMDELEENITQLKELETACGANECVS